MENKLKNKTSSKILYQTPKASNKKICLRKKNDLNQSFSSLKSSLSAKVKENRELIIPHKNTTNHLNTPNNKKVLNKVKEENKKFPLKITKENMYKNEKYLLKNIRNNIEGDNDIINKQKIKSKSLNIIPLPTKKKPTFPKKLSQDTIKKERYSPQLKKNKSFTIKDKKERKSDLKCLKNNFMKDKEIINKNILKSKNEIDIIPISKNNSNNSKSKINSAKINSRIKKIEFLYIPHIVLDPLDVLTNQIELILQKFEERIKNLNKLNKEKNIKYIIKSAYADYSDELIKLYQEKENELIKINNNYNKEIYNLLFNDGKDNEELIKKNKEIKIKEVEKIFQEKKEKIKIEFKNKIEEIKKTYNIMEQIELNKKLILEMKNKFLKVFNDKNMINKKGINFSLSDYKNSIRYSKNKIDKLRNKSFQKK